MGSINSSVKIHAEPLSKASSVTHRHVSSHVGSKFATIKRNGNIVKNQKLYSNISGMTNHFLNALEMETVTGCLLLEL